MLVRADASTGIECIGGLTWLSTVYGLRGCLRDDSAVKAQGDGKCFHPCETLPVATGEAFLLYAQPGTSVSNLSCCCHRAVPMRDVRTMHS